MTEIPKYIKNAAFLFRDIKDVWEQDKVIHSQFHFPPFLEWKDLSPETRVSFVRSVVLEKRLDAIAKLLWAILGALLVLILVS